MLLDMKLHFKDGHHHLEHGPKMSVQSLNLWYPNGKQALQDINLDIPEKEVTSFIGPSGCGKTTLLKCLNRMNEVIQGVRITGDIQLDGRSIYDEDIEIAKYRRRFGWVAQAPNPFPKSVYANVAYAARIHGLYAPGPDLNNWVEKCLRDANLWEEVKDRLDEPGTGLSGGQMQRLCIARALSQEPDVLLMDEPCSALDPIATSKVEELIEELKQNFTVIIITHNLQQAARISQNTAFFHLGKMLETGDTEEVFSNPKHPKCDAYVHGAYG